MIIEFLNGPLNGYIHEVECGWPMPDAVALPDENGFIRHYYKRIDGEWQYEFSEPIGTSDGNDW